MSRACRPSRRPTCARVASSGGAPCAASTSQSFISTLGGYAAGPFGPPSLLSGSPASPRSVFVSVEFRRLVVLACAALDLFLFGQEPLELRVGLLHERARLLGGLLGLALARRRFRRGSAAPAARADDPAGGALTGRVANRHRRFLADLVLGGRLVRQDLALVDPDLHADPTERRTRLGFAVVDVGAQRVQRNATL